MFFQQIIDRIDEEREAQDLRWGQAHDDVHSISCWVDYTRNQLWKAKQLHTRKLIVVGGMAVACIESCDRRFNQSNRPRADLYKTAIKHIHENAFVAPIHTLHQEVISDLAAHLEHCQLWSELVGSMHNILTRVMRYLYLEQNYLVTNNTDNPIDPHLLLTDNKTGKTFEIKAGVNWPTVTLTFKDYADVIEALTSIAHLDVDQR